MLAKVLRIDVDHPDRGQGVLVPKDNPFVGDKRFAPETWAYGLRNPWRISYDAKTGHLWVGNNGQDLWEQAYLVKKGENYGWSVMEGSHPFYPKPQGRADAVRQADDRTPSLRSAVAHRRRRLPRREVPGPPRAPTSTATTPPAASGP